MIHRLAPALALLVACAPASDQRVQGAAERDLPKPRVVVTTDPELDDSNSLIRYLLYTTDFETQGLIYASSGFHWKGDGQGTTWFVPGREYTRFGLDLCPCESWRWPEEDRFIHDVVGAYEEVHANLLVHHPDYPDPAALRSVIRTGNVEFDGDISRDSPGSDLIRDLILDGDDRPLHLLAWGGQSTIARALKSIQERHEGEPGWSHLRDRISRKVIIMAFGDQDDTYARYIGPTWPKIELREMSPQTYGYGARGAVLPEDRLYLSAAWTAENISNRGPLGALYRVWGDGRQMVDGDSFDHFGYSGQTAEQLRERGYVVWTSIEEPGSFISEGDTPTFLNLVDNGLRGHEAATFGGWGGRHGVDDGPDGPDPNHASARFFGAAQRDFAARLQWSVTPERADANHPPAVRLLGPATVHASPGAEVRLEAEVHDPDGDSLSVRWWQYEEAGSFPGRIEVDHPGSLATAVRVPEDAPEGSTIHMILEVTDDGSPALTRYQRIVITVSEDRPPPAQDPPQR